MRAAILAMIVAFLSSTIFAADLVPEPSTDPESSSNAQTVEDILARYLTLELIRLTFDVTSPAQLRTDLDQRVRLWGHKLPTAPVLEDLDRQLLAEASYYIVSLQYLIKAGGANFPSDREASSYANDALVRLEALQRELPHQIASRLDISPLLLEAEKIRALTEGYREIPQGLAVFAMYQAILSSFLGTTPSF